MPFCSYKPQRQSKFWQLFLCVHLFALSACAHQSSQFGIDLTGHHRPQNNEEFYTISSGDTLYSIAFRFNKDVRTVAALNHLTPPYRIYPGQKIILNKYPVGVGKTNAASRKSGAQESDEAAYNYSETRYKKSENDKKVVLEKFANHSSEGVKVRWSWPVQGSIISNFNADNPTAIGVINKGVNIAGRLGQPVKAAAEGVVVYSGDKLIGYGNLIIVKHSTAYLSAYGYNSRLFVKEGDRVKAGQKIAEIGSNGTNIEMLHFEIRLNGKPVNPLDYLPHE